MIELLSEYLEYKDGALYWVKSPNSKAPVGSKVGSNCHGYLRFKFRGKNYSCHRVIYFLQTGSWPEVVDHIDGNTLNNTIENLRAATKSDNKANSKPHKGRATKGAYRLKSGRYMSVIQKEGVRKYLGVFDTEAEAAMAYAKAAPYVHGEFAKPCIGV